MTPWWLLTVALAGCGRIGFDVTGGAGGPDAPGDGHDEDGDGVPDDLDTCPHVAGPQDDRDGDGVGDLCDPEPDVGRQRIALFATLRPSDQPYPLPAGGGGGTWTQQADALHFDGDDYGELKLDVPPLVDARVAMGIDILAVRGGASAQHQLALALEDRVEMPHAFVELNEYDDVSVASITRFTGSSYTSILAMPLATRIHTGPVLLQATAFGGAQRQHDLDTGWPGETYMLRAPTPDYDGTTQVHFNVNNLEIAIRYVIVIATR